MNDEIEFSELQAWNVGLRATNLWLKRLTHMSFSKSQRGVPCDIIVNAKEVLMKYISVTSFGKPEVLQVVEGQEPTCGKDEVMIRVAFVGIGGIDAIVRRGDLGAVNPQPPFTPGLEVSGEVMAVDDNVTTVQVGDKVAALLLLRMGGYAEVVCCPATSVVKLPEGIALADAASLVNPTTGVVALDMVRPQDGETLIVHGATGGLGGAIGQVAKAMHPNLTTIGVVRSKAKRAHETSYDQVITTEEFTQSVKNGDQYAMILDPVGGELRRTSLDGLMPRGRMLVLGNVSGDADSLVSSQSIWLKSLSVRGLNLGLLNSLDPIRVNAAAEQAAGLLAEGKLDLAPAKVFPFSQATAAHEYLESGQAQGRLVLEV
jgi:NADPH2:quinone reductase